MTSLNFDTEQLSSMELYSLQLQKAVGDFTIFDAVTRAYVDQKVSQAKTELTNGASTALDTFKELEDYLTASGVAGGLVEQISALSAAVSSEITRAQGVESGLTSSVSALQSEVDASQIGAGLNSSGAYVVEASRNYISAATSLKSADALLDSALYAQVFKQESEQKASVSDRAAIRTEFKSADDALDLRIDGLASGSTQAVTDEAKARADADSALSGRIVDLESDPTTQAEVDSVASNLTSEVERAGQAESNLGVRIDDLSTTDVSEGSNQYYTDNRVKIAQVHSYEKYNYDSSSREAPIEATTAYALSQVNAEFDDMRTKQNQNVSAIGDEVVRAGTAEGALAGRIDQNDGKHAGHSSALASHDTTLGEHEAKHTSHESDIQGLGERPYGGAGFDVQHNGTDDKYLYFSSKWRLHGSVDGKRLIFEYNKGDDITPNFVSAVPFISH